MQTDRPLTPKTNNDPEATAALSFDAALRAGLGPRAAMRKAFEDAGVLALEDEVDDLRGRTAHLQERLRNVSAFASLPDDAVTASPVRERAVV